MAFSQQLMSLKNGSKPANNPTTTVDILQPPPLIPDSSVGKNYIPKITFFFLFIFYANFRQAKMQHLLQESMLLSGLTPELCTAA